MNLYIRDSTTLIAMFNDFNKLVIFVTSFWKCLVLLLCEEFFFSTAADSLQWLDTGISQRSVARGFVLLGKEIGVLYRELKQAQGRDKHPKLQLVSYHQQL